MQRYAQGDYLFNTCTEPGEYALRGKNGERKLGGGRGGVILETKSVNQGCDDDSAVT